MKKITHADTGLFRKLREDSGIHSRVRANVLGTIHNSVWEELITRVDMTTRSLIEVLELRIET